MQKLEPMKLAQLINRQIANLHEEGELSHLTPDPVLGFSCQAVFGFDPNEVDGIHTHKIGVGDGVWFRLTDERVVNSFGESDDQNYALYDTVGN